MFGGPIDMTPFGAIVKGIGVIYWVLVLGALALALWKPRRWWLKLSLGGIVLAAGVVPVALHAYQRYEQQKQAKARLDAALAHFEMRCKSAGEKIQTTAEDIEGIVLLKIRATQANLADQYALDDPYGRDCGGEDCIRSYLIDHRMVSIAGGLAPSNRRLFRFVEVPEPHGDLYGRYYASGANAPLTREFGQHRLARYAVNWEDISTPEDRRFWIAGGRLSVIDLQTNAVVAERTGFLLDRGQGSTAGARTPWTWARSQDTACPTVRRHNLSFVERILKPKSN